MVYLQSFHTFICVTLSSFVFINIDVVSGEGLTAAEIAKFTTSGSYSATISVTSDSIKHVIRASGMPDHATQMVNPNTPTAQNHILDILKIPNNKTTKGCLPMGKIGITTTGVAIYNPLTIERKNAVEGPDAETFDSCDGHPQRKGEYHYHKIPASCMWENKPDNIIGVAADGYAIYGPNLTGHAYQITTSDLDQCRGMYFEGRYIYVATYTFPYFMACYNGEVIDAEIRTNYNCETTSSEFSAYLCACSGVCHLPIVLLILISTFVSMY